MEETKVENPEENAEKAAYDDRKALAEEEEIRAS